MCAKGIHGLSVSCQLLESKGTHEWSRRIDVEAKYIFAKSVNTEGIISQLRIVEVVEEVDVVNVADVADAVEVPTTIS